MTGYLVMGINEANGLVDKYSYITNNNVAWGAAIQGLDEPQDFQFGTSTSGFGAAFTYVEADGRQRVFVSANSARRTHGQFCTEPPYESCTKNNQCTGSDNKCKRKNTDKSWGMFEIQLPLKVPADCWNYGTDTKTHKRCDEVVPRGPNNPGAMLRLSMLAAPTSNGPVRKSTSAKAP